MHIKKTNTNTNTKSHTSYVDRVQRTEQIKRTEQTDKTDQTERTERTERTEQTQEKVARPGRTLLISFSSESVDNTLFNTLAGYQTSASGKSPSTVFVTFDTVLNAQVAFDTLRTNQSLCRVKYSRYPVFFHINGLTESSDYNMVKQDITTYVETKTGSSVLFFKLYRKGLKYLNSGSLTVDTNEGMRKLLSNEQYGLKNWNTGSYNGTFYHFNKRAENVDRKEQINSH